ncbi:MAG TPA: asparagine synthase-related protein [Gemmatimonadaceae bacterium]|nr:asparagine synthase-related protein [Gemmatimonadaceae bacterium]
MKACRETPRAPGLERDVHPDGGNLLTLSDGVDSSALAGMATGVVGRRIGTFSLLPSGPAGYEREVSFIRPLADRRGFDREWEIRVEPDTMLRLLPKAPTVVFHVVHPALCALPGMAREWRLKVMFGGNVRREFADEVCGSAKILPDWAAATSAARLHVGSFAQTCAGGSFARLSHIRWRLLRTPVVALPAALLDPEWGRISAAACTLIVVRVRSSHAALRATGGWR